jgi:hypothetical protein
LQLETHFRKDGSFFVPFFGSFWFTPVGLFPDLYVSTGVFVSTAIALSTKPKERIEAVIKTTGNFNLFPLICFFMSFVNDF